MRTKILKSIISLSIICTAIFFLLPSNGHRKETNRNDVLNLEVPRLNDSITNAMSEIAELSGLDNKIESYLNQWGIQGASLAIMRNDSLVYAKGYGWAEKECGVKMGPGNILRLASVSKLVTSIGIMALCEQNKLRLNDKVFGDDGILNDSIFTARIKDKNYYKITVEHLLRHEAGFTSNAGDPMFRTRDYMNIYNLDKAPDSETLIYCILSRRLTHVPGTTPRYSNVGYLLLSMIIERVTGMDYEDFIMENIFKPAGISDMHIAGNYYSQKRDNEVKYYMHAGSEQVTDFSKDSTLVEKCYGGNNVTGLSGAGAWVGSSIELAKLISVANNIGYEENILSKESIDQMTKFISPSHYGIGWNDITEDGVWTRTGSFSGTTAIIKHYPDGECWIMLTNTSTYRGPYFSKYTSSQFTRLRKEYSKFLPKQDLFLN